MASQPTTVPTSAVPTSAVPTPTTMPTATAAAPPEHVPDVPGMVRDSMLHQGDRLARGLSGTGAMWRRPYGRPDPRRAVATAPTWYTSYPMAFMARGRSFLEGLADQRLWRALGEIGIKAVHTGPVKLAGGLTDGRLTPSIDGHFDRIGLRIDPLFGTDEQFRALCAVAREHGAVVIDDVVPGHTGKGPDFRLAELGHEDYPGVYHMVSIDPEHWPLLPEVPTGADCANLDVAAEAALADAGYIVGPLQRVLFFEPGVKETNWSATGVVRGSDGVARRWVYLHYFKAGQPSLNWLDPTCAGMRLVLGDVVHSLTELGTSGIRLDANGFLGIEVREGEPAWSEGHPLSIAANHYVASLARKLGAFTFQELNLAIDDIAAMGHSGADLSYDFVNRPAYHHALATGDTEFLRLTLRTAAELGVDPASLVHALQNHDELTYELQHFASEHRDDVFAFRGRQITGADLATTVRADLVAAVTGEHAPYNLIFTTNGIACTTASFIAACLGHHDLTTLTTPDVARVRRVHLLLAAFNAWQPGVFALSGWDLTGALPLDPAEVAHLTGDGDTRWIHRAAHDLIGPDPGSPAPLDPGSLDLGSQAPLDQGSSEEALLPVGRSLYGPVPQQLTDDASFASQLRDLLAVRERTGIALGAQLDVPEVAHPGILVMIHRLPTAARSLTVLNFTGEPATCVIRSHSLSAGTLVVDAVTGEAVGEVSAEEQLPISLGPYESRLLLA